MIIAYFVHGRGRGHSSRALSVIKKLILRKYTLKIFAGRDAYPVLKNEGNVSLIQSIFPETSPFGFIKRLIHDYRLLRQINPSVVISDGDAPCTWAAKFLGIPVLSIGHALVFPYCNHAIPLPQWGLLKESLKVRMTSQWADFKFILHFCPLPLKDKQSVLVRPDLDHDTQDGATLPFLVSYFRDGNGEKVLRMLTAAGCSIKNFGHPVNINGVQNFKTDQKHFKKMLRQAQGIVSSAGSNTIFEAMALKKPMLLTYLANEFEQSANAQYITHLGLGQGASFDTINSTHIQQFVHNLDKTKATTYPTHIMPSLSNEVLKYLQVNFK
ncbi:hypothetical protein N7E81_00345 [Reichenbachiella carrageenanivorans]|uniref:Glycosyl transferase family 28 C-terminal domain-containing protein n=1 Tax=Reichenbachiella carrageenanivorans TaxID=2979869 RepID=A0ABY6D1T0_9BACT|nr:glycosyltransferase family protein [Reichenbachiella carrageenanivorans]UXX79560.1 hypothetical protein N7E81_00345 [Reichenbachiella carrageenanivorans]